jgi:hypothetical protein
MSQPNWEHDGPKLIEFVDVGEVPAGARYGRIVSESFSTFVDFDDPPTEPNTFEGEQ